MLDADLPSFPVSQLSSSRLSSRAGLSELEGLMAALPPVCVYQSVGVGQPKRLKGENLQAALRKRLRFHLLEQVLGTSDMNSEAAANLELNGSMFILRLRGVASYWHTVVARDRLRACLQSLRLVALVVAAVLPKPMANGRRCQMQNYDGT